ncbi:hypothetical protein KVR01_010111 [Diaporthe batatas]|uniref:uncharacterized protein n=1 Tax=Diaporthe batatas TaxID=748121 RepID=UPI001D04F01B|nr:uncharacterized protein KVR01_010111 [Diaporthe batatas]KAG8160575.1 hypothetical protein KVR01_010111 [Diaporthe batatas]
MAPEKTIDVGRFGIASKADKDFVLTVSTSVTLSLPDHFPDHLTANALRDQVQAGALWLTRARSCRLTLAVHFEPPTEVSVEQGAQWRQLIIEKFQSLQVWCDLGLELRLEQSDLQSDSTPSATSVYYMQHVQQRSGLFVPQGIPCGHLSELFCSFRYAAATSTAPAKTGHSVPRSRTKTPYNLREVVRAQTEPRHVKVAAFWALPLTEQAERLVELAQNALNLMLGLRTRYLGFLHMGGTKPPALLELAPAVWNAQYFQRVVSRARLIPSISSALGNLTSTRSPELLHKIESLVPEAAADTGLDEALDELQRRCQVLLLRSGRDQKIKASSVQKVSTGNDFTDYTNLDHVEETLLLQEDSQPHEVTSGFAGHDVTHLELESSHGSMNPSEGNAEGTTMDLGPEDSCADTDMGVTEWIDGGIDGEMLSCSESLLGHNGFYEDDCECAETLDPIHGDREYQKQHVGSEAVLQEHGWENSVLYYESDSHDHYYYESSDIEEGMQPTTHSFEDCSAESNEAAVALEDFRDDLSGFVSNEDDDFDTEIQDHLCEEGIPSDEWQYEPCESNDDHEEPMLHGIDTDDGPGPNYCAMAWGPAHHSRPEATGDRTGISLRGAPDDWSQVPRKHARHSIGEPGEHIGPPPTAFTTRLAGYQ